MPKWYDAVKDEIRNEEMHPIQITGLILLILCCALVALAVVLAILGGLAYAWSGFLVIYAFIIVVGSGIYWWVSKVKREDENG